MTDARLIQLVAGPIAPLKSQPGRCHALSLYRSLQEENKCCQSIYCNPALQCRDRLFDCFAISQIDTTVNLLSILKIVEYNFFLVKDFLSILH